MEYKTQVFVNHEGDHYRTRLTHTLEVAQIARTIARALRLNEDLTEAIALGHDLGHTPFGHAGERTLHQLMVSHGGFEHNAQALRIVDILEDRYPEFPGLNLSAEVRRGLLKDKPPYPGEGNGIAPHTPIEARVVDLADEIAYNSHDCDDGLESGLLSPEILRQVDLWVEAETEVNQRYPKVSNKKMRMATVRALIDRQVRDVITETLFRMQGVENQLHQGQQLTPALLEAAWPVYSKEMNRKNRQLKDCLRAELYTHPRVVSAMGHSVPIIERLFAIYNDNPERLPATTRNRIEAAGRERAVADYIAGMTDRYAEALDRMFSGK